MRQGVFAGFLALVLFVPHGALVAQEAEPEDWAVMTFTAPEGGADDIRVEIEAEFRGDGSGPVVLGYGRGGDGFRYVDVYRIGGGSGSVTTTKELGGLEVEITERGSSTVWVWQGLYVNDLAAGETASALLFAANAELVDVSTAQHGPLDGTTEPGSLTMERGSGSTAIYAVDPGNEGPAVAAGDAAAGTSAHAEAVGRGLVGSLDARDCSQCTMSWQGPDDRGDTVVSVDTPVLGIGLGGGGFAGPAGDWFWSWAGVDIPGALELLFRPFARPVIAAYAPIGEGWRAFDVSAELDPPPGGGPPPENDDRADASGFGELPYTASQSTAGATLEEGEPTPCGMIGSTVWYAYEAPGSGDVVVDTHGSDYDTVVAVYEGDSLLGCNDDGDATASDLQFAAEGGRTYLIQVGGHEGDAGGLELHASSASEDPPAEEWGEPGDQSIRPGMPLLIGDGAGCTANFVFRGTGSRAGTLYLGTAAHCVDDDIGAPVYHAETGEEFGRVAYSSFKELGIESYPCPVIVSCSDDNNNDFALIEIDDGHRDDVHPAMLHFGGPTGLVPYEEVDVGDKVLTYGNSPLRPGPGHEDRHEGYVLGKEDPSTVLVYTVTPGIFGDSGSGAMLGDGRALGVVVTIYPVPPGQNGVSALSAALDFAATVGWDIELQTSELLNPGLLPALPS